MIKLKITGIFICFLISWLLYHYIDKKPDPSYEFRLQSAKSILSPPRYYIAKEVKKGKIYQIVESANN